jgi:hypothetical protein
MIRYRIPPEVIALILRVLCFREKQKRPSDVFGLLGGFCQFHPFLCCSQSRSTFNHSDILLVVIAPFAVLVYDNIFQVAEHLPNFNPVFPVENDPSLDTRG